MSDSTNIDQIVHEILDDMPLKGKAIIANLDEDKVPYLPEHRNPRRIRINEHTLAPIIDFHYSLTGWANCLAGIAPKVRLSAEGADHNGFSAYPFIYLKKFIPLLF